MRSPAARVAVVAAIAATARAVRLTRRALPAVGAAAVAGPACAALPSTVVPLTTVRGGLAANYVVDGGQFVGVVDTGSPFLLVDGTCGEVSRGRWGCYPRQGRPGRQGSLNDASLERFGGQETIVEWRRGAVEVGGAALRVEPVVFGVVRSLARSGGDSGIYLGLIKHRQPIIRPTFLEQCDARALRVDLRDPEKRTLEVSTRADFVPPNADAIPLVDLRRLGAPVEPYAGRVRRLVVNGEEVRLERPVVAVVDTGTTGLTISDSLLGNGFGGTDELPLPGAAIKHVDVEFETESGGAVTLGADARVGAEFPLVVTPARLPWFDESYFGKLGRRGSDEWRSPPHVLFVGLSFLENRRLTIDLESRRMLVQAAPRLPPRPEATPFRGRPMYASPPAVI